MDTITKIAIGFAFTFILAMCGVLAFYVLREEQQKEKEEQGEFDERQKNIRRKGFTIGFFILMCCSWIFAILKDTGIFSFEKTFTSWLCSTLIALGFVMTYLIWHDAAITPKQEKINPYKIRSVYFSFGGSCLGASIMLIINKNVEGLETLFDVLIMTSIFLFYVGINHIAKQSHDKKHKMISDDDDLPTGTNSEGE